MKHWTLYLRLCLLALACNAEDGAWLKTYPPWSEPGTPTYDAPHVWFPILGPLTRHGCFPSRYMSMRIAVSHLNRRDSTFCPAISRIQNNFQVSYELFDTNANGVGAVEALLTPTLKLGNRTKVVLGPNSSGSSRSAANLLTVFGIPNLSWSATSSSLSDKFAYPYFSRVVAPDAVAMAMIADFLSTFIGNKANMIFSDADFSAGQAQDFRDAAVDAYRMDVQSFSFPNSGSGGSAISQENLLVVSQRLESIRQTLCRVVFASAINEEAWGLVRSAFDAGMVQAYGWVWVGGDGFAGGQYNGDLSRTAAFAGFIYVVANSAGPNFAAFSERWSQDMPSTETPEFFEFPICHGGVICSDHPEHNNFNTSGQREDLICNSFSPLAYDAVIFMAMVADVLLGDSSNPRHPDSLTAEDWANGFLLMQKEEYAFDCLTGYVTLDEKHDRRMGMSYFNLHAGSLAPVQVVTWSPSTGYTWVIGETLVWPSSWNGTITDSAGPPFIPSGNPPECAAGFELLDDSCVECLPGRYSVGERGMPCMLCETGKFQAAVGASGCMDCSPGFVASTGQSECEPCPPGSGTLGRAGEPECTSCERGRFQNLPGQAECEDCVYGATSELGALSCFNCSVGSSTEGEQGAEECLPCEAGMYADKEGQAHCLLCPVGTYSEGNGNIACTPCGDGGDLWSTMQTVISSTGQEEWLPFVGARNLSSCGCSAGARLVDKDVCSSCTEGWDCRGMDDVRIAEGYFAAFQSTSVFRCHGDEMRCIGGVVGATCASGRRGLTCAECEDGMTPGNNGACESCGGSDLAPFILAVVAGVLLLAVAYHIIDTQNRATQSHAVLLCAMTLGMLVTLTQQLGVVSMLSVNWVEPLSSMMEFFQVLSLDVKILRLNCVSSQGPVQRYATKLSVILMVILCMLVIHVVVVLMRHEGQFRQQMHSMIGSIGTLFMVFYISVTSIVLAPLQCESHPNGKWTIRSFQSILCWDSEEHVTMLALSIVAFLLVPVAYYVGCIVVVRQFLPRMQRGDTVFLKAFAFLFFRFRAECYAYVLIIMMKSFLVACVLALPDTVTQIFILEVILLVGCFLTLYYMPWRVFEANLLDCASGGAALLTVCLSSLFVESKNTKGIAWLAFVVIVGILLLTPTVILLGVYKRFRKLKPFQFFLSHHKASSGAYTRLLKLHLVQRHAVKREVFVDSDNLDNLDKLFDYVGSDTEVFVIVGTDTVFSRPWCVGEMCMAHLKSLKSCIISLPSCKLPDDEFIREFTRVLVGSVEVLTENGMTLEMLQQALSWTTKLPRISAPGAVVNDVMEGIVDYLLKRTFSDDVVSVDAKRTTCMAMNGILFDWNNLEAASTAHLIVKMLTPMLSHKIERIPSVIVAPSLPKSLVRLAVICTNGILENPDVLKVLAELKHNSVFLLPVIAEQTFRFPTRNAAEQLARILPDTKRGEIQALTMVVLDLFKEIAVTFIAQSANEQMLQLGASDMSKRLQHKARHSGRNKSPSGSLSVTFEDTQVPANVSVSNTPIAETAMSNLPSSRADDDAICWERDC